MSDETDTSAETVDDSTSMPPPAPSDTDYSEIDDETPHKSSEQLSLDDGGESETESVGEEEAQGEEEAAAGEQEPAPAPTLESLQEQLERQEKEKAGLYARLKEAKRLNERFDQLEADLEEMGFYDTEAEEEEEEVPDPVVDPTGASLYEARKAREAAERAERKLDERGQESKRQEIVNKIGAHAQEQHKAFLAEHPDYEEAAGVVLEKIIVRPLRALGRSDDEIAQAAANFTENQILTAYKEGSSASARVYAMAQELGYKPAESANGDEPEKPEAKKPESKVATAARKQAAAKTVAVADGSAGSQAQPTAIKTILKNTSDEDYDGVYNKIIDNVKAQLQKGGRYASDDDAMEAIETGLVTTVV